MKTVRILKIAALALPLTLAVASCGTHRKAVKETPAVVSPDTLQKQAFLQKVNDNAQYARFITSKVKFSVEVGAREMTLTGNLKMKRDDVIRLQLMAFGFVEAGRLEFTKEYVLIMDRINKLYLKASYAQLDFLRNNQIDFYVLQSLFWNELFQQNGRKYFPMEHKISFTTPEKEVKLGMTLNYIGAEENWEPRTEVSSKYRQVSVEEILQRFMSL